MTDDESENMLTAHTKGDKDTGKEAGERKLHRGALGYHSRKETRYDS